MPCAVLGPPFAGGQIVNVPSQSGGLLEALAEVVKGKALSVNEAGTSGVQQMTNNGFGRFMQQSGPALREILSPGKFGSMMKVGEDLTRANRSVNAVKGNEPTKRNRSRYCIPNPTRCCSSSITTRCSANRATALRLVQGSSAGTVTSCACRTAPRACTLSSSLGSAASRPSAPWGSNCSSTTRLRATSSSAGTVAGITAMSHPHVIEGTLSYRIIFTSKL